MRGEPRTAGMRQLWLIVLASVWLSSVCNLALWRELAHLPGLNGA